MPPVQADTFLTVAAHSQAEPPKTKGSRFMGDAFPADSPNDALEKLERVRSREHAATHHCWAYRIGHDGAEFRYSDDGEPGGSAGLPIFREIEGRNLTDALVVVTRYYGGTKLGTGGLIRAYGEAAAMSLENAQVKQVILRTPLCLLFGFSDTSPAMRTIERFDINIAETSYTAEGTELLLSVRRSEVHRFIRSITDALGGRGEVQIVQK